MHIVVYYWLFICYKL